MTTLLPRTVLFADLRGSTGLFETLGNVDAAALVTQSVERLGQVVTDRGGVVVKTLGDGLMAIFEDVQSAVDAADDMHGSLEQTITLGDPASMGQPALKLQVGMAYGEVVLLGGDCFGDAVNVASRLLDKAGDRETLATRQLLDRLEREQQRRFRSLSSLQLRGRQEPVEVHRLEATRFGDTVAALLWAPTLPMGGDFIRLSWLDLSHVFAGPELPAVLGRSSEGAFCIDDTRVSRSHARVEWHGGTFQVSDLSYNGTFVSFAGTEEFIALRRGSCTLHGSGVICLGAAPRDPTAPAVRFEVLSHADALEQSGRR